MILSIKILTYFCWCIQNQFKPVFVKLWNRFEPVVGRHRPDRNELLVLGRPVGLDVVVVLDVHATFRGDLPSVLLHLRRHRLDVGDDALLDFVRVVEKRGCK